MIVICIPFTTENKLISVQSLGLYNRPETAVKKDIEKLTGTKLKVYELNHEKGILICDEPEAIKSKILALEPLVEVGTKKQSNVVMPDSWDVLNYGY